MSPPTTSVVVCAYTLDRWTELGAALAEVAAQRPHELLLVVDHNDVLHRRARTELRGLVPGLRVLANSRRRGLSGARNTAIAASTGEVVIFLDDDATPEPGWLAGLRAPYADAGVMAVGGAATPVWPAGAVRPVTLPAARDAWGELDWVVGSSYTGLPERTEVVRNLMGCNMSFRREVFAAVGGFSEDLGRVGRTPLGCEETELCIRARRAARAVGGPERIVFVPTARVAHHVSPDRLTWSYLLRRGWAEGISKAAVARFVGAADATRTERRYVARVLPRGAVRQLRGVGRTGPRSALGVLAIALVLAATTLGYLRGRLSRELAHRSGAPTAGGSAAAEIADDRGGRLGSAPPAPPPSTPSV